VPSTARNNAWLKNRTAALNLRNLISRGLNHRNGAKAAERPLDELGHRLAENRRA
jgi:hypothetical protein